ncbi:MULTISPECIES: DUF1249 domain-containing protein [unclassified Lysobacter]|uniref:DUF1249 domain-containing protein n=1 Tax=unclassified Lysobacter TaxID=2635362 RepID=UPI001BE9EBD7|nr:MULTISPECIES: DUF1249 domain-containing protein [unclassified Lysobacter]MBT2746715.1 DUF1249 domain-containing protein [Lysobacter sp. ISL-42]MBT2751764.1 DUF1249 domain-containing protein [Lysobacter sp. ISL-50]MBT2778116.1 DUF1249 domain-containing protein [Lysobacter sp. ISL-54]MBT2781757.1 DUF1249 domain-containing protein [Lysobacter sp. ISL-52]
MTQSASRFARIPKLSRFGWLMGLYAENHDRLTRMFAPAELARGTYLSAIGDGLDLRLDVIEQHRYTTEMRLTYALLDPLTGEPDPSAYLRLYHDAHQVEATHCYIGRRWQDVIGMYPPPAEVIGHRMRMNTFLGKWLEYLAERGHCMATLRPVEHDPASPDPHGPGFAGTAKKVGDDRLTTSLNSR